MKPSFSQKRGLTPVREIMQVDSIDSQLRIALWNSLQLFWEDMEGGQAYLLEGDMKFFCKILWADFYRLSVDELPGLRSAAMGFIKGKFMAAPWYEVYDFIEFIADYMSGDFKNVHDYFNLILESEFSGYRFVNGELTDITDSKEIQSLEEALSDTTFSGVNTHLATALSLYSDRNNPDYRNSIKESISAVESMARIVTGLPKATLGQALKAMRKSETLHPALINGFDCLYGYTSDEDGIRHSMQDDPNLTSADAKYFLLSCTSFVNYLKSKI